MCFHSIQYWEVVVRRLYYIFFPFGMVFETSTFIRSLRFVIPRTVGIRGSKDKEDHCQS